MGKINDLRGKKIAIYFETRKEMKEFLKECDKENITWSDGVGASDFIPFDAYDKICITFDREGLMYCSFIFYKDNGYKVINYKNLIKNGQERLVDIERIARNKETTIVFWNDDTKTIVKLGENQADSPETAILWAYFEKNSGLTKTQAHKTMTKLIDSIHNQNKKQEKKV